MNKLSEALEYIISEDKELEVIDILLKSHKAKYETLEDNCRSYKCSLKAIRKINARESKGELNAIELLSDIVN